jgi:Family of unknown function (DUF6119)
MPPINFNGSEKYEIKIFQIDTSFYEFQGFDSYDQIIQHIVDEHRKLVNDNDKIGIPISFADYEDVRYYTYVYNETEKDSYWKSFLPPVIADQLNFTIQKLSFVLFSIVNGNIFAIVGGGGIRVIVRYINHRFGLDFYEHLTDLSEEIISISIRGISGKLTSKQETFREGQKLIDTLNFTNIPSKINLFLREDLKDDIFDIINFNTNKVYLEICSYFNLKYKISFQTLHKLFIRMDLVLTTLDKRPLTSFIQVKDKNLCDNTYRFELYRLLREDMMNFNSPARGVNPHRFDIDFLHPSNLQGFYECDSYELKARGKRLPFFTTNNKGELYKEGLKFIYNELGVNNSQFDFNGIVSGIKVKGFIGENLKTNAMFTKHITCEIEIENSPVFQIDSFWFKVKNDFVNTINDISSKMINEHYLRSGIINELWDVNTVDEDAYNSKYHDKPNYWVFDKALGQNIELCDIMYEDDEHLYFIHVKTGFDAKIRDLSNQIQISANRFSNERNSGSEDFIGAVIDSYNAKEININRLIDRENFISKFRTGGKNIIYVMAFKSNLVNNVNIKDNIDRIQSNIAKYSLIQCVRDMNAMNYPLKIVEIMRT